MTFVDFLNDNLGVFTLVVLVMQLFIMVFQLAVLRRQSDISQDMVEVAQGQAESSSLISSIEGERHAREGVNLRLFVIKSMFENDLIHNKIRRRFWDVVITNQGTRNTILQGFKIRLGPPLDRLISPNIRIDTKWYGPDDAILEFPADGSVRFELRWMLQQQEVETNPRWVALLTASPEGTVGLLLNSPDQPPSQEEILRITLTQGTQAHRPYDPGNHSMRDRVRPGSRTELEAEHARRWPPSNEPPAT